MRRKVYDILVVEKMLVQGIHQPLPALADVEKTATGYREIPVARNPLRLQRTRARNHRSFEPHHVADLRRYPDFQFVILGSRIWVPSMTCSQQHFNHLPSRSPSTANSVNNLSHNLLEFCMGRKFRKVPMGSLQRNSLPPFGGF